MNKLELQVSFWTDSRKQAFALGSKITLNFGVKLTNLKSPKNFKPHFFLIILL